MGRSLRASKNNFTPRTPPDWLLGRPGRTRCLRYNPPLSRKLVGLRNLGVLVAPFPGLLTLVFSEEANHEVAFQMHCTFLGGADSAGDAGTSCSASAPSTSAERRHSGTASASRFCVDSGLSTLEW